MAKARPIVRRRKAVRNIRKITQTMQLISTARFQKCLQRATATKPYTDEVARMVQAVVGTGSVQALLARIAAEAEEGGGGAQRAADPRRRVLRVLRPNPSATGSILLVITSNRGLCGAYNATVLRAAQEHRGRLSAQGLRPAVEMVGKKGVNYFRFLGIELERRITDVEDRIAFARVAEMADRYVDEYVAARVARVDVAYMQFHSVGVQRPVVAQLLPIEPPSARPADADAHAGVPGSGPPRPAAAGSGGAEESAAAGVSDFEFSPAPELLLARLIPETVRVRLFQFFNDAIVSEQVARMVAMKAATDAAGEMIKFLTRQYNRARQSQITMELLDIMGGVEALK